MKYLTTRGVTIGLFGWIMLNGTLLTAYTLLRGEDPRLGAITGGSVLVIGGLLLAYWRGWEAARYVLLTFITLVIAFTADTRAFPSITLAAIPAIAAVIGTPAWIVGTAAVTYCLLLGRSSFSGVYIDLGTVIIYASVTVIILLGRLVLERALTEARDAAAQAEADRTIAATQAAALAETRASQDAELRRQQELLNLVATLETPGVSLADGVLFAPLVGRLDARRTAQLTERLLETVHRQRARLVVMDVSGAAAIDAGVAQSLLNTAQAVRLLGCEVAISGISAEAALILSGQQVSLSGVTTVRSPQEALALFQQN